MLTMIPKVCEEIEEMEKSLGVSTTREMSFQLVCTNDSIVWSKADIPFLFAFFNFKIFSESLPQKFALLNYPLSHPS